jgi:hypothetical protein
MRTALDSPVEDLDADEKEFVAKLREHGWFNTTVPADDQGPGFSYTTGFWAGMSAPEVIVFSLKFEIAHNVFWDLYRDLRAGAAFPSGQRLPNVFGNTEAVFLPVSKAHYRDFLGWNRWFYSGDEFPCSQLIWPDKGGKFPWETGFDKDFVDDQPNLTGAEWPMI